MIVGKSVPRVDSYEKVTGRAKYTADITPKDALVARVLHSSIANGLVTKIDTSEAEKIEGVEKIVTCFDVPDIQFPTAGHPWSTDPGHQDPADRKLLNQRVRYHGDDVAAVIARDEISAARALAKIKVAYEEYPAILDPEKSMQEGAPQLHEKSKNNILAASTFNDGDFEEAIKESGLIKIENVYETPAVQHCHLESVISFAYMENGPAPQGRIVVVSSTQIPHIIRRIVAQALGIGWGKVRIIKPYLGGGFGNKQDALYEPLNAFLTTQVGGRPVKLELSREEVFTSTRVRHAIRFYLSSYVRPDGRLVARTYTAYSNQGAYASHGHGIVAKGTNAFRQLYQDEKARKTQVYTVYTNTQTAGAMRGYGIPQATFAIESHIDDVAQALGIDPLEFRFKNLMPVGYTDPFSKNVYRFDAFHQCVEKCKAYIGWDEKREKYRNQSGPVRRGVGVAFFWYNTAVWPISLEASSCRMVLNQDGSVQIQLAETEIGQGADTVFAQMTADAVGIPFEAVHVVSAQDTDVTPFGTSAYASRQSYVGGAAVKKTGTLLREKILSIASERTKRAKDTLSLIDGIIVDTRNNNESVISLSELATETLYSTEKAEHITAESTAQVKTNAYSFGCTFAEVEVDMALGKITLLAIINAHDCGTLLNPKLAEAQVHGGMSMGIGYGLGEQYIYDEKTGKLLNGSLLDYKLSTMMDHPHLEAVFVEYPEPSGPFGNKALGEPPAVSPAPAIRNAVLHATGVGFNRIPLTPHLLYENPRFK
jgi:xanthine dehydrogenase molybdenum-binding subunit